MLVIGIFVSWNDEAPNFETFRIDNLNLLSYLDSVPLEKLEGSPSVSFGARLGQFSRPSSSESGKNVYQVSTRYMKT